jgi:hypothetical protein
MERKEFAAKTIFLPEVDVEILDHELEEDYLSHVSKKKMKKNSLKEKEIEKQMIDHEVEKRTVSMKKLLKKETPSAILEKMKNDDQAFMEGMDGGDDDDVEEDADEEGGRMEAAVKMKKGGREKKKLSVLQDDLQKYLDLLAGKGEANGKKKKERNE